jgi:hypothetical protein
MARAKSPKNGSLHTKQVATTNGAVVSEQKNGSATADLESEIRRRAYELYERRGCEPGHEHEDWLVAEQEVVARYQHQGA